MAQSAATDDNYGAADRVTAVFKQAGLAAENDVYLKTERRRPATLEGNYSKVKTRARRAALNRENECCAQNLSQPLGRNMTQGDTATRRGLWNGPWDIGEH